MNTTALKEIQEETSALSDYLTVRLSGQLFGLPILQVQDVLGEQKVTPIPLAPPSIAGSLNLRGRIVTAIDVRKCLRLEDPPESARQMSVVIEQKGELFSLIFDEIGDVLSLDHEDYESNPATLDTHWRDISTGIYRLKEELLIVMDVIKLIEAVRQS